MPITDYLRHNAAAYGNEIALVEINPEVLERKHVTWRDYDLIESTDPEPYRREITWSVFDREGKPLRQPASLAWREEGRQGRHPAHELS